MCRDQDQDEGKKTRPRVYKVGDVIKIAGYAGKHIISSASVVEGTADVEYGTFNIGGIVATEIQRVKKVSSKSLRALSNQEMIIRK